MLESCFGCAQCPASTIDRETARVKCSTVLFFKYTGNTLGLHHPLLFGSARSQRLAFVEQEIVRIHDDVSFSKHTALIIITVLYRVPSMKNNQPRSVCSKCVMLAQVLYDSIS